MRSICFAFVHGWLMRRGLAPKDVLMDEDCKYFIRKLNRKNRHSAYRLDREYLPSKLNVRTYTKK